MPLKLLLDFLTGNMALVNVPATATDISGGLDNMLLEGGDNFLLESAIDDVMLLE